MGGIDTVEKLREAVSLHPHDGELRADLIELLLDQIDSDQRHATEAVEHLDALMEMLPNETWVIALGARTYAVVGDNLAAARFKRRLRDLLDDEESKSSPDEDDWDALQHPAHPSVDRRSSPQFRLLIGGEKSPAVQTVRPTHRLDDIAGLATVKKTLAGVADAVAMRTIDEESGWPGGLLLYGPPNCGKSFLAEALACEMDATIWNIDLNKCEDASAYQRILSDVIESSHENDVVLYLDNIDMEPAKAIVSDATSLTMIDDACIDRGFVVVGAATMPWFAPTDVVRSGRLGKVLLVLPPDGPARREFLKERFALRAEVATEEIEWLVAHTDGHSFGDLQHLVDMATNIAREAPGRSAPVNIDHKTIRESRRQVGPSSADWLNTAGHHAIVNESGGLYDDLLRYFRERQHKR